MSKEEVYRCDICGEITDTKELFGITFVCIGDQG